MGGREVGGLSTLMSGHRDLAKSAAPCRDGCLVGRGQCAEQPGKTAVDMFEAVRSGEIKGHLDRLYQPAQSMPNVNLVREALQQAELVVVQEAFAQTDTTDFADVLLPATTWGEKEGTVTNFERRITHVRRRLPPGEARADWAIGVDFARGSKRICAPARQACFLPCG